MIGSFVDSGVNVCVRVDVRIHVHVLCHGGAFVSI